MLPMREQDEEEPEPDEDPDEEPAAPAAAHASGLVPSVDSGGGGRDFEYRTELLEAAQLTDGKSLPDLLTKASAEEWDLVDILPTAERHVVLLRRRRKPKRETRPVGFRLPQ